MPSSSPTTILFHRLEHGADLPLPRRMTPGSSGFDMVAALDSPLTIEPGRRALIPTGFRMAIPTGCEVQVRSRSGLAFKHGVMVLNTPGTIDADYRGEVKVILANLGEEPFTVARGDRIAQMVPMRVLDNLAIEERNDLPGSDRGAGGFGHTGK